MPQHSIAQHGTRTGASHKHAGSHTQGPQRQHSTAYRYMPQHRTAQLQHSTAQHSTHAHRQAPATSPLTLYNTEALQQAPTRTCVVAAVLGLGVFRVCCHVDSETNETTTPTWRHTHKTSTPTQPHHNTSRHINLITKPSGPKKSQALIGPKTSLSNENIHLQPRTLGINRKERKKT